MKPKANDIGHNLAKIRFRRKLTQDQLAARLQIAGYDMTRQVVANLESRRRIATDRHITGLVKVLRCSLDELFFGTPPSPKSGSVQPPVKR
jgi:transcriptional regulator with XRE-family HTH domain